MALFDRLFKRGKKDRPAAATKPAARRPPTSARTTSVQAPEQQAPQPPVDAQTPEQRCGITAKMPVPEIRKQLAKMFRRYNALASSLDPEARNEAEHMLDLIVQMREKHLS